MFTPMNYFSRRTMIVSGWGLLLVAACSDANTGSTTGNAAASGSSAAAVGGAAATATMGSYIGGAGIGVADLAVSQEFYTSVFGMQLRYELPVPNYVNEKVMYFKDSKGSDVVLMSYIDGATHNYTRNPVKLVFYVPSAQTVVDAIRAKGLEIPSEPAAQAAFGGTVIGFARDPDGYVLEIIESPGLAVPYLGAIGLGVSDIAKAKDFYTRVLGMVQMGELISVPNVWDEVILQHTSGKGSALVLLHYTDGGVHNYLNNPIKTVHFVADARATAASVEQEGLQILSQPAVLDVLGTKALIGLARDPDGYTLELVTTQ
jgi:catechol 2,3-dioxygenase-like lactoylglutathione lyase family enzyme